ncbi:hypothetical protein KCP71_23260 [Salmonella enterica subsp. enterica]|nr:hypothetical protein KCP71_23260 [Salmonella enterica subsp. enterica]
MAVADIDIDIITGELNTFVEQVRLVQLRRARRNLFRSGGINHSIKSSVNVCVNNHGEYHFMTGW